MLTGLPRSRDRGGGCCYACSLRFKQSGDMKGCCIIGGCRLYPSHPSVCYQVDCMCMFRVHYIKRCNRQLPHTLLTSPPEHKHASTSSFNYHRPLSNLHMPTKLRVEPPTYSESISPGRCREAFALPCARVATHPWILVWHRVTCVLGC